MKKRLYVICHMLASIDGKILTRRWKHLPEGNFGDVYDTTAAEFNVNSWLVGTKTLREFFPSRKSLKAPKTPVPSGDHVADHDVHSYAVGLDTSGTLRFNDNEVGGDHLIIVTTQKSSPAYRAHLRQMGISYLVCGRTEIDFADALQKLVKLFGIKKLLLEGGGLINGAMLHAGLIDEISQLIVPIVDGGGAQISSIYDIRDTAPAKAACGLRLIEQRTLKHGIQWLRYRVKQ